MVVDKALRIFSKRMFERHGVEGKLVVEEEVLGLKRVLHYAVLLYGESFPIGTSESESTEAVVKAALRAVIKAKKAHAVQEQ